MKEQKSVKQWLETLPEPIRSQALLNANRDWLLYLCNSQSFAIATAFRWNDTPQGWDYWDGIQRRAAAGEFDKEPKPETTGEAIYGPNPTDEVELYLSPDEELIESIGSECEYFKARCSAAEAVIEENAEGITKWCDNPRYASKVEAYAKWQALKNQPK